MIFVVPENDLEAVEIISLLKENKITTFITRQLWGASWEHLEDEIKEEIRTATEIGDSVYGVELAGHAPEGCTNIDHHCYSNDDRSNLLASIEQVALVLGVELTHWQKAVAINDKSFVGGMMEAGIPESTIKDIAEKEYAVIKRIQGITDEQEREAEDAVRNACVLSGCTVVKMSHSKCSTVTKIIPMAEYKGGLLVVSPDEVNYYGPSEIINKLKSLGGWSGSYSEGQFSYWGRSITPEDSDIIIERCYENIGNARRLRNDI